MKNKKHATYEEKLKIVKAYKNKVKVTDLVKVSNYSRTTIYEWIKLYESKKLRPRKEGSGNYSELTTTHKNNLIKILKKPASAYGFETDLWNTKRIQIVCRKELKLTVSKMSVWRFLSKMEYSFKKVQKQYYEVDKKKQKKWVEETLPEILATIEKHKAILYFEDESNIQLSPVMGKSWSPVGEKITHTVTGNRGSVAAISAISNDGRLLFNLHDGGKRFNSDDIILFLKMMLDSHPRRHLVVIMDQAPCHKSKRVKIFEEHQKRLHLFYLPPRSPEFNPDEKVWAHLKNHDLKSHLETTTKGLKALAKNKLTKLSKNKEKVSKIFRLCDKSDLYL